MSKVSFKISYLFPGKESQRCEFLSIDRRTQITSFINQMGGIVHRKPESGEEPLSIALTSVEDFTYQNTTKKRVCLELSYESDADDVNPDFSIQNTRNSAIHTFVKSHYQFICKNPEGNNINNNTSGMALFELYEESKEIEAKVEKNIKLTQYQNIITGLYEENLQEFVNTCFGIGMTGVEKTPVDKLYNELMHRVTISYVPFENYIEHRNREMLVFLKQCLQTTHENELVIRFEHSSYLFEGELIGQTEEEVFHYFEKNPQKKINAERKLGKHPALELTIVPATEVHEPHLPEANQMIDVAAKDAARIRNMKLEIDSLVTGYRKKIAKLEKDGKAEEATKEESNYVGAKERLRQKYSDVGNSFEDYFKLKNK